MLPWPVVSAEERLDRLGSHPVRVVRHDRLDGHRVERELERHVDATIEAVAPFREPIHEPLGIRCVHRRIPHRGMVERDTGLCMRGLDDQTFDLDDDDVVAMIRLDETEHPVEVLLAVSTDVIAVDEDVAWHLVGCDGDVDPDADDHEQRRHDGDEGHLCEDAGGPAQRLLSPVLGFRGRRTAFEDTKQSPNWPDQVTGVNAATPDRPRARRHHPASR